MGFGGSAQPIPGALIAIPGLATGPANPGGPPKSPGLVRRSRPDGTTSTASNEIATVAGRPNPAADTSAPGPARLIYLDTNVILDFEAGNTKVEERLRELRAEGATIKLPQQTKYELFTKPENESARAASVAACRRLGLEVDPEKPLGSLAGRMDVRERNRYDPATGAERPKSKNQIAPNTIVSQPEWELRAEGIKPKKGRVDDVLVAAEVKAAGGELWTYDGDYLVRVKDKATDTTRTTGARKLVTSEVEGLGLRISAESWEIPPVRGGKAKGPTGAPPGGGAGAPAVTALARSDSAKGADAAEPMRARAPESNLLETVEPIPAPSVLAPRAAPAPLRAASASMVAERAKLIAELETQTRKVVSFGARVELCMQFLGELFTALDTLSAASDVMTMAASGTILGKEQALADTALRQAVVVQADSEAATDTSPLLGATAQVGDAVERKDIQALFELSDNLGRLGIHADHEAQRFGAAAVDVAARAKLLRTFSSWALKAAHVPQGMGTGAPATDVALSESLIKLASTVDDAAKNLRDASGRWRFVATFTLGLADRANREAWGDVFARAKANAARETTAPGDEPPPK